MQQEVDVLDRGLDSLERITGQRPVGYREPIWETTYTTAQLLLDREFFHDSSLMECDAPWELAERPDDGARSIVEIPVLWSLHDSEQYGYLPDVFGSGLIEDPAESLSMWHAELYEPHAKGMCFTLTAHPFLSGRLGRLQILEELVTTMTSWAELRVTTAAEVASHTRSLGLFRVLSRNQRSEPAEGESAIIGPVDGTKVPRYAGSPTFARLPRINEVSRYDVAVPGASRDGGASCRPGARFGPSSICRVSRHLRPAFHPGLGVSRFRVKQAVDTGDVPCNPFDTAEALPQIDDAASEAIEREQKLVTLGGDHAIALGALRAVVKKYTPVALFHCDAHLDTWASYFGSDRTHGTVFRRAYGEGLLIPESSIHLGIRGLLYDSNGLVADAGFGFSVICAGDFDRLGAAEVVGRARELLGDALVYLSVDIDVFDPAFAPGTGAAERGGFTSRDLLALLRGMPGEQLVTAEVVEVSPAYDHAVITSLAGTSVAYEIMSLMAGGALSARGAQS